MKKFLFLSILCYACNVVYGQHYIPVKKMISNYKEQKAIDTLKNHDIIYNIEESPEAGIFMEQSLLPSDLQRPKDIRAEWCFEYSSGQKAMLYLKKIYSSKEGKSNEASIYKNKFADKNGEGRQNGYVHGMNVRGESNDKEDFNRIVEASQIVFNRKMYLYPMPDSEMRKTKNLVQNPGW